MGCSCLMKYVEWIGIFFGKYGEFVAKGKRTPWIVMSTCIIVNIGLSFGILKLEVIRNTEELYTPQNSVSFQHRDEVQSVFQNQVGSYFNQHALSDLGIYTKIIIRTKNGVNILSEDFMRKIKNIDRKIRTEIFAIDKFGRKFVFSDLCAIFNPKGCVIDGEVILHPYFMENVNNISYPYFQNRRIAGIFGNVKLDGGILREASMVKLRYNLRDDNLAYLSRQWEIQFVEKVSSFSESGLDISYLHSDSINTELKSSTLGDIIYFILTIILMIVYASFASIPLSMNMVAWRPLLSLSGVFATILAIGSALGFTCLIGVKFVSLCGVMPFLVIGIGLDDMFVLMSGMSGACADPSGKKNEIQMTQKMHLALKGSAVAITITSLTDFLAFGIGSSSVFLSVRNFCITTGIAVMFCYFNQLFFFVPCLVINERRVEENRHFLFCCKRLKAKDEDQDKRSCCSLQCCSGHKPVNREEYDGVSEKIPKILLKKLIRKMPFKIFILIVFSLYLGLSIYGILNLKQGLALQNLAKADSYFFKFKTIDSAYFREDVPFSFVIRSGVDYSSDTVRKQIDSLLQRAKQTDGIVPNFEINWLNSFKKTPFFNATNEASFVSSLRIFLNTTQGSLFRTDIAFNEHNSKILASRFYILSNNVKSSTEQGGLMLKMRELAAESDLNAFEFSPAFIYYEQFVYILPATLQTVGIAVAAIIIITTIFMPQPVMIILVSVTMVMILLGMFGFMYFWDLTLSSITMIHLIMTVGFSVDFSAHICHAYLSASGTNENACAKIEREERVGKAIDKSGGPIINAALSSIVGILILTLSTGYIFQSFFKLMLLVILFGLAHSVFFLPIVLSFIGPLSRDKHTRVSSSQKENSILPFPVKSNEQKSNIYHNYSDLHPHFMSNAKYLMSQRKRFGNISNQQILPSRDKRRMMSFHELGFNRVYSVSGLRQCYSENDFHPQMKSNGLCQFSRSVEMKNAKTTYNDEFRVFLYRY